MKAGSFKSAVLNEATLCQRIENIFSNFQGMRLDRAVKEELDSTLNSLMFEFGCKINYNICGSDIAINIQPPVLKIQSGNIVISEFPSVAWIISSDEDKSTLGTLKYSKHYNPGFTVRHLNSEKFNVSAFLINFS